VALLWVLRHLTGFARLVWGRFKGSPIFLFQSHLCIVYFDPILTRHAHSQATIPGLTSNAHSPLVQNEQDKIVDSQTKQYKKTADQQRNEWRTHLKYAHTHTPPHTHIPSLSHTSKGHHVEWAFPMPASPTPPPDFRPLALLCLPEGAHNVVGLGHVYFTIELALPKEPRQVCTYMCIYMNVFI